MNEIEKLYRLAELEYCQKCRHDSEIDCIYLCENKHPEFTAEKQLELIKWLSSKYGIYITNVGEYSVGFGTCIGEFCTNENFEDVLAESINHIWQNLTETEREEIRKILKI